MIALAELKKLPIAERLQLVGDLWDSIAEEQDALPDPPELVAEVMARDARFLENPSSASSWEEVEKRILSRRA
ncbi:MAG: addiction module protein [Verrucomicrobia bacterium]|nr:addiction module protein [Verrucomicrobiota bacterium]